MSDVKCPYCESEQEINHDDGYGYGEDEDYEQHCIECGKVFKFQTSIHFYYEVFCADQHDLESTDTHPHHFECTRCDYSEIRRGNE